MAVRGKIEQMIKPRICSRIAFPIYLLFLLFSNSFFALVNDNITELDSPGIPEHTPGFPAGLWAGDSPVHTGHRPSPV